MEFLLTWHPAAYRFKKPVTCQRLLRWLEVAAPPCGKTADAALAPTAADAAADLRRLPRRQGLGAPAQPTVRLTGLLGASRGKFMRFYRLCGYICQYVWLDLRILRSLR